ncbi:MAG: hypothetical protein PVG63_04710 [Anaerolineales bacterium]
MRPFKVLIALLPLLVSLACSNVLSPVQDQRELPMDPAPSVTLPSPTASPTLTPTGPTALPSTTPLRDRFIFANANIGVTLRYPSDWAVSFSTEHVEFATSPDFDIETDEGAVFTLVRLNPRAFVATDMQGYWDALVEEFNLPISSPVPLDLDGVEAWRSNYELVEQDIFGEMILAVREGGRAYLILTAVRPLSEAARYGTILVEMLNSFEFFPD